MLDFHFAVPPELIPQFLEIAKEGHDMIYARPMDRQVESWAKRKLTNLFYKSINSVAKIYIPSHLSDFRLLSRRAVEAVKKIK
jgi:hypothetical protein